jgi:long-chain acyl-CoA synthetase
MLSGGHTVKGRDMTQAGSSTNRGKNLGYFFDGSVSRYPDKDCIIDLFGGIERRVTYRQLDERMNACAAMLAGIGIRPGERVAMLVGNRTEFIEFFFGAMRIGAIPALLNHRLATEMLVELIDDSESILAIVDPACHRDALQIARRSNVRHRISLGEAVEGFAGYEIAMRAAGAAPSPPNLGDDAQAFQPYTSGSTGRPKGAIMTHRGMLWYVAHNQKNWPSSPDDRGLIALPLFHKNALRGTVKPMLYAGGSFVLMPAYEPVSYLEALASYRCTYSRGVAAVFTMFLQHREAIERLDLSALRSLTIGSAVVAPQLLGAVERALPDVKMSESYGMTEGGSPLRPPTDGRAVPRGSVGVPAPGVEVKLMDASGCESDSLGELVFRSPYVCLGYHKRPDVTAAKVRNGWLHSGDVFEKDASGFYYFRSRVDDMFSCGGENIYPKEVEDLLFSHPDVANAVVAPVSHSVKGFVPAALVVLKENASSGAADLKAFCLAHGPAYAHPRFVDIVQELPLNGAGKVDRVAARDELARRHGGEL